MPDTDTDPAAPPRVPLLYCPWCESTFSCPPDEALDRLRGEWPECCGREVTFYVGVDRHGREVPGFRKAVGGRPHPPTVA